MNVYKITYRRPEFFTITDFVNIVSSDFDSVLACFKRNFKSSTILSVEQLEGVTYVDKKAFDAIEANVEKNKAAIEAYSAAKKASLFSSCGVSADVTINTSDRDMNGDIILQAKKIANPINMNWLLGPVQEEKKEEVEEAPRPSWEFLGAPK